MQFAHDYYDYAPSIIQNGNTLQYWWCGYGPGQDGTMTDVIWYRTYDTGSNVWGDIHKVFTPTPGSSWDARYVCDPSVVKGSFHRPGDPATYSYAMYYGGANQDADTQIGVSYSNDGVNWTRYDRALIAAQVHPTTYYGAGQPSMHNIDGGSRVRMFYYDNSTSTYGPRLWTRTALDGITFDEPVLLTNAGLPHASVSFFDVATDRVTVREAQRAKPPGC
ncbi:hypothetical protein ABT117_31130 [Streptomyces sp. NPDC002262]|uniref:hypothetical protein n=1 Tax=Streptomyces sp. NPDC002262 TaxID=3154414 RepID=UPI00331D5F99